MSTTSFDSLYKKDALRHRKRYDGLKDAFENMFGISPAEYFSAPGRTEVIGNHTDHNCGRVMAAAVNLDVIAAAAPTDDGIITIKSEGHAIDIVNINELEPVKSEINSSVSLVRGVAAGLKKLGFRLGGFTAYTTSEVLKGSGLSSSAAFEVLVGTIISHMFNGAGISSEDIAKAAQFAENVYFGKPSGLMDQMACSVGGFISIDFADVENPVIDAVDFDPSDYGFSLCIVDTKGSHSDLTSEYASIPAQMKSVAEYFGKTHLRELKKSDILENICDLRSRLGDRAVLRSLHFFDENQRVENLFSALKQGNIGDFLNNINASGESSYKYLQNVYAAGKPNEQGISLAVYLGKELLDGEGAIRVHGGGFAGTVQAFVPSQKLEEFKCGMEAVFGKDSCHVLDIRSVGGTKIIM